MTTIPPLSDEQWAVLQLLPAGVRRLATVHSRDQAWLANGTWDRVLTRLQADADADARGELDGTAAASVHMGW